MTPTRGTAGSIPVSDSVAPSPTDAGRPAPGDSRDDDIVRRLKSVEGHVRGIQRMVVEDAYCVDVMRQILAVERALEKVGRRVLDRHLHHCVTRALGGDDPAERERVIQELLDVFEASRS